MCIQSGSRSMSLLIRSKLLDCELEIVSCARLTNNGGTAIKRPLRCLDILTGVFVVI